MNYSEVRAPTIVKVVSLNEISHTVNSKTSTLASYSSTSDLKGGHFRL